MGFFGFRTGVFILEVIIKAKICFIVEDIGRFKVRMRGGWKGEKGGEFFRWGLRRNGY